jgi:hypothetical protein
MPPPRTEAERAARLAALRSHEHCRITLNRWRHRHQWGALTLLLATIPGSPLNQDLCDNGGLVHSRAR